LLAASFLGSSLVAFDASAATLQTNIDYGGNGAVMNLYVPDVVDEYPAIVVSLHYCNGAATNAASWVTGLADQHGFIAIAPGLPSGDADGCWDVGSTQSLTHDGGSHSQAIAQMVSYTVSMHGADTTRVYVLGASSGAMMTNVLLGAYPDVFAAGSVFAGVPFGCWTAGDGWTGACADGNTTKTAQQWGDLMRNAYPGYTGARPRVQLFHGTSDTTLHYKNLAEEIKQWTNVHALSETPTTTEENAPKSGWTRTSYENTSGAVMLEVGIGQGVGHDVTGENIWAEVVRFFSLDQDATPGSGGTGGEGQGGASGSASGGAGSGGVAGSAGDGAGGLAGSGNPAGAGGTLGGASGAAGAAAGAGGSVAGTAGSAAVGGSGGSGGVTSGGGSGAMNGGSSGAGNSAGSGGTTASGGTGTFGAAAGSAGAASDDGSVDEGGGCHVGPAIGSQRFGALGWVLLAGVGVLVRRRRRHR
jgi:poly(hydroxyalkanoate) depolymerase family esterase